MFRRIAIVNRGEPARRLIHAVRELAHERSGDIRAIALHTEAERQALFVREADEAVLLRPTGAASAYLDHDAIEAALIEAKADAVWVGWGFVAEDPTFVELCDRLGIAFIGPTAAVMRTLGDKVGAKLLAEQVGVPVAPWSGGAVETIEDALRHAKAIGYPLLIKASSGGGGRGIRFVGSDDELPEALERARAEAGRAFGDDTVFMEKLVSGARHVEVQVIADHHGTAWGVGVRDCSIQRRNQKLLEESGSPVLTHEQSMSLRASAAELVRTAGYRNAGTVEFLYKPDEKLFAFLEVNTRLQVEHPVTELATGLDLVKLQIRVAEGERLVGDPPPEIAYAIEARLNAEDPERGFAPAPGTIELLRFPTGPGIRVDTGVMEGDVIPPEYDSMIAKIIASGRDRAEARSRLTRALEETTVVVRGGTTNKSALLHLLGRPEVIDGTADTGWLDRLAAEGGHLSSRHGDVALIAAAIDAYEEEEALERESFYASARAGRPRASHEIGLGVELRHQGNAYKLRVAKTSPRNYRVAAGGRTMAVGVERLPRMESRLAIGDRVFSVVSVSHPPDHLVEVDGVAHRVSRDEGGVVRAPAPALVVAVKVAPGEEVAAGQAIVVLESMKMETAVTAPFEGRVLEVHVKGNTQVDAGAPLLRLEPSDEGTAESSSAPRLDFDLPASDAADDPRERALAALAALRSLILGYDVGTHDARRILGDFEAARGELPADDEELVRAELGVLTLFADVSELFRNRPAVDEDADEEGEQVHTAREHFHAFLRSLDPDREGLPEPLRRRLQRAVIHYGVTEIERGQPLAMAAYRIFLSQQRAAVQLPAVTALLERHAGPTPLPEPLADELRATLDLLIPATQLRHPAIGELARSVRYRNFDQRLIQASREQVYTAVRGQLDYLAAHPGAPDYAERIEAVIESPQPLVPLLSERVAQGLGEAEPILEVLTRRHYKIRTLDELRSFTREGRRFMAATYLRPGGRRVGLLTTLAEIGELPAAVSAAAGLADLPSANVVIDFYVAWPDPPDPDAMAAELARILAEADLPEVVGRIAISVSTGAAGAGVDHFTFRRGEGGLAEERVARGMHPMIARRLRFWRLSNFDVSRLEAVEDVHLFHCAGRAGVADERLVALAEVRALEPVRDAEGKVAALPEVEHVLAGALDGIRRANAGRPARARLQSNHVFLYVWRPIEVPEDELLRAGRRLAPMTAGLGVEEVLIHFRSGEAESGAPGSKVLRVTHQPGAGVTASLAASPTEALAPLDDYTQKVRASRRRGAVYPYELVSLLAGPEGGFVEHDLDESGRLVPVERPPGRNTAGIVVGVVRTPTSKHPEGMARVALLGDPTKSLGSVAEPECARVVAALDLAERMRVPVEWFALSSGAKISRDSGVENMDWVALALRRLVEHTQAGGEVNVIVAGINVGAQPYWNAEATMLMHTRGILVMTPDSAMVLTGKQALDYSGGVSADDNFGIGGYDRIMGPNGQAQYWAPDLDRACQILFAHYAHTYVAPGERLPRIAPTADPADRDVRGSEHRSAGSDFTTVGDIFSQATNPERKKGFDVRALMRAVIDQDQPPLERWPEMADADTAVVFDAHLGGRPVALLGIESTPVPRRGFLPADGPDQWTAGTLFPMSSKKAARAINAASGNRPIVVLANLSGFDGSPESLRKGQLEYGAEIGRAVVNFDGPVIFCVVARYHGGAFVVFSRVLNDNMQVIAVEGSYASVIGGAPAAAVVFAGDVNARTDKDPRVVELEEGLAAADEEERAGLRLELAEVRSVVRSEMLGRVATEFDRIHSVQRAQEVGAVHDIIPAERLRPHLIAAVEKGIARALGQE